MRLYTRIHVGLLECQSQTDPFDPEVSIIVSNLPEENDEDLNMKINTLKGLAQV